MYSRVAIRISQVLFAAIAFGQPAEQMAAQPSAPGRSADLKVQGIGRGIVLIDGVWQFHLGDDPSWAQPSLDDSRWQSILTDDTWGDQGHPSYTGFAWYRRHLKIALVSIKIHFVWQPGATVNVGSSLHTGPVSQCQKLALEQKAFT